MQNQIHTIGSLCAVAVPGSTPIEENKMTPELGLLDWSEMSEWAKRIDICICGDKKCGCNNYNCRKHNMTSRRINEGYISPLPCHCNKVEKATYEAGQQVDFKFDCLDKSEWYQGTIKQVRWFEGDGSYSYFIIKAAKHGSFWYDDNHVATLNSHYIGSHDPSCHCVACLTDSD